MQRNVKVFFKKRLRGLFEFGQKVGVDVLPRHFYSEIPNIAELKKSDHWKQPFSMAGVHGRDIGSQLEFVQSCCSADIVTEIRKNEIYKKAITSNGEPGYGETEADFLFAFVANRKPAQIVQIGCGVSTAVCLQAAAFAEYRPDITCIEPYPTQYLLNMEKEGKIRLLRQKVQEVDLNFFKDLGNDLLFFVDSTHTLGPAGEVSRIILEMLPVLKKGVYVHFHDITFPYDYNRKILDSMMFFWHESVLVHAFLAFNSRFRLLASLSMLHYDATEKLKENLPNYVPARNDLGLALDNRHFPSAAYIQVTGD